MRGREAAFSRRITRIWLHTAGSFTLEGAGWSLLGAACSRSRAADVASCEESDSSLVPGAGRDAVGGKLDGVDEVLACAGQVERQGHDLGAGPGGAS